MSYLGSIVVPHVWHLPVFFMRSLLVFFVCVGVFPIIVVSGVFSVPLRFSFCFGVIFGSPCLI